MRILNHIKSDDILRAKLEKIVSDPDFKLLLTLAIAQVSKRDSKFCEGAWAMHDAILTSMTPVDNSGTASFGLEYKQ